MRSGSSEFIVQTLPDGSTAIFEVATKNVYSLNPSAAAAWEACASPTTLSRLAAEMSRRLNRPVTEDLAHEAVSELVAVGLVSVTPAERLGTSRRAMLKQVAGVALPVVLVLTGAEQRAHAQSTGPLPSRQRQQVLGRRLAAALATTQGPLPIDISKAVAPSFEATEGREPLAGVEFDIVDRQRTRWSDTNDGRGGYATIDVTLGVTYKLVETFAPPSLDAYLPPPGGGFTFTPNGIINAYDFNNVLKPSSELRFGAGRALSLCRPVLSAP